MNKITQDFTPVDEIDSSYARLNATYASRKTRSLKWRKQQLKGIIRLIDEQEEAIIGAIQADLRKSRVEAFVAEIAAIKKEAQYALKNLKKWTAKKKVKTPMLAQPGKSWVKPEPLGVVLCITSWNFPWHQSLTPMVGAIAAGNCVMVKPSELCTNSAALIAKLYPQYLDPDAVAVVQGGPEETQALLRRKFDHIIYTGGGAVARIVMKAAAEHLTPVTLELGGKSPAIVDQTADIATTARRLVWAKLQCAGQICINADYLMVHESVKQKLIDAIAEEIEKGLGPDPQKSSDFARIINERHHDRLTSLLSDGDIVYGGNHDKSDLYIEPTLIENAPEDSKLMTDEIFGPILPIITWRDEAEIYDYLAKRDKPLAMYIFSQSNAFQDRVLDNTTAGNIAINDLMLFAVVPELPFGGVGASGMGAYTGTQGFCTFSHFKPILKRGKRMDLDARYIPYNSKKEKIMRLAWK
jgi:aldehyde dehydrogenase (NAD+)